jgi:hypothetical protein
MSKEPKTYIMQFVNDPYRPYNIEFTDREYSEFVDAPRLEKQKIVKDIFEQMYPDIKIDHPYLLKH